MKGILKSTFTLSKHKGVRVSFSDIPFDGRLSFVANADMWSVVESGDWAADNRTGAKFANELLGYMREDTNRVPMLGHVIRDMVQKGQFGPIEIGFVHRLATVISSSLRGS